MRFREHQLDLKRLVERSVEEVSQIFMGIEIHPHISFPASKKMGQPDSDCTDNRQSFTKGSV